MGDLLGADASERPAAGSLVSTAAAGPDCSNRSIGCWVPCCCRSAHLAYTVAVSSLRPWRCSAAYPRSARLACGTSSCNAWRLGPACGRLRWSLCSACCSCPGNRQRGGKERHLCRPRPLSAAPPARLQGPAAMQRALFGQQSQPQAAEAAGGCPHCFLLARVQRGCQL